MMRRIVGLLIGVSALFTTAGCQTDQQHALRQPHVEEFNPPPEEARYNNPPEDKYRKPDSIKDQAGQMGSSMGPMMGDQGMGGMGGMGMGGRR